MVERALYFDEVCNDCHMANHEACQAHAKAACSCAHGENPLRIMTGALVIIGRGVSANVRRRGEVLVISRASGTGADVKDTLSDIARIGGKYEYHATSSFESEHMRSHGWEQAENGDHWLPPVRHPGVRKPPQKVTSTITMPCPTPGCGGKLAYDSIRYHANGTTRTYHACDHGCGMSTMFKAGP